MSSPYRGRFAPSPTGPLHFGSLVAAVGSYLEAKRHQGEWLVRIEDIDRPRCKPEWGDHILRTLEAFGFEWQGAPAWQSRRASLYRDALRCLTERGFCYPCACTRREIADSSLAGIEGPVYPGTCRGGVAQGRPARALRVRTDADPISFSDAIQGTITQNLEAEVGDFIVLRADKVVAYQLAVVVDDAEQHITHVVRGADLLASTPRQIHLQRALGYATPAYGHLPVATNGAGEKLSKQTGARAVDAGETTAWLAAALTFLGHGPPAGLTLSELWQWAFRQWDVARVPRAHANGAPAAPADHK